MVYEVCAVCGEEIDMEDERYEMPDGDIVCTNCVLEWADKYRHCGEVNLRYADND